MLGSLTRDRAPPPKNRRRPSLKKRREASEIYTNDEEDLDKVSCVNKFTFTIILQVLQRAAYKIQPWELKGQLVKASELVINLCNHVLGIPQDVQQKRMVHPLVDEAKNKDVVSTTPPRSPRSARSSRIQPPSASTKQDVSIGISTVRKHCKMLDLEPSTSQN